MASSVQQEVPTGMIPPSAHIVGNAFVHQYYLILHQSPELVHRFYHDNSKLGRPDQNGVMSTTTTMQAINKKIISLEYGCLRAEISTVDSQESYNGGILVFVTGYLTGKDNLRQKFSQTFFLAPQDKGYFVMNDVFRYIADAEPFNEIQAAVNDVETPLTSPAPTQDLPSLQENHLTEQFVASEEVNGEEPSNPSENVEVRTVEHEPLVHDVVDEILKEVPSATETVESNIKTEEAPKKSYASIVKVMKESLVTLSTSAPANARSVAKIQEQQLAPVSSAPLSETLASNVNAIESGNNQEGEVNGWSIYIRGLPMSSTHTLIENEFKKFGPIKSGGIQIRSLKGACFGFVEFEVPTAVQSAIEASPITIGGRQVVVEEKRSTSRGNRGRYSSGRGGGFRNEGPRGNYVGGRGRGESNNRNEFENRGNGRGGYTNRGGDRYHYQRTDSMGSIGGGRMNRAGGLAVINGAAGTMPQQVPASA